MAGVVERLIEIRVIDIAKKFIADGGFALEKISAICDLPIEKVHELAAEFALEKISAICGLSIEKVRELAATKNNQTLE